MNISTKKGDEGETDLPVGDMFEGEKKTEKSGEKSRSKRVRKSHAGIHFLGTLDELNSWIGFLKNKNPGIAHLEKIQEELLYLSVREPDLPFLEKEVEKLEKKLPPLKNFILPGDTEASAIAHIARTVCRRAERFSPKASPYLNRLSDYLFLVARVLGKEKTRVGKKQNTSMQKAKHE